MQAEKPAKNINFHNSCRREKKAAVQVSRVIKKRLKKRE